ncbi:MAG TPA: hypothetical protein PK335_11890 [Draconibacterium sp.]|nr:hypothetical protein [Draconibacterium sp.]
MKNLTLLFFLILPFIGFSQETKNKLESGVSFSLNSNGIAPIPAFSLDKPALIASASFKLGRFSYSPTLAYALDMKPWYIDNWFHYRIVEQAKFELKTGINFSTFLTNYHTVEEDILKGERYLALSLTGTTSISKRSSIIVDYWNDNGLEKGSISGHFFDLIYNRSNMRIGDDFSWSANLMFFYINYDGENDGLFFSPTFSLATDKFPLTFYWQATQAISTNISDVPGFRWNVGLSYTL